MAYQLGNSVRLSVTFKNYAGAATNPDAGTDRLTMYGATLSELLFTVVSASLANDGVGIRHWDWVPTKVGTYTYEWYALLSGEPSIVRRQVQIVEV